MLMTEELFLSLNFRKIKFECLFRQEEIWCSNDFEDITFFVSRKYTFEQVINILKEKWILQGEKNIQNNLRFCFGLERIE